MFWNINGIHDKLKDKDNQTLLFTNDVIIIVETHSSESQTKFYDTIPGYKYHDFPRKFIHPNAPKPSGGIGILSVTY